MMRKEEDKGCKKHTEKERNEEWKKIRENEFSGK
jgi:hypothetical protein